MGWVLAVSMVAAGGCDAPQEAANARPVEEAKIEDGQPTSASSVRTTTSEPGRDAADPRQAPPNPPAATERASTPAAVAALPEGEILASLDEGCKLLGSDDEAVYLTPTLLGSKTILKVSMGGELDRVTLDERMQALTVEDGFVYGCAGKSRGERCELARAKTNGGAVERLVERGKVVAVTVDGDRMWTLEVTGPNGATTAFAGSMTGGAMEELPLEAPMAIRASGGAVVAMTGNMRRDGKVQVSRGDAWRTLVSRALTRFPHIDGDWVYFEDDVYRLARAPLAGGPPQILRDRAPDSRQPAFGMTGNSRYLMWLEGEIVAGQSHPKVILKRIEKPR